MSKLGVYSNDTTLSPQDIYYALTLSGAAYRDVATFPDELRSWAGANYFARVGLPGEVPSAAFLMRHAEGLSVAIEGTTGLRDWLRNVAWGLNATVSPLPGRVVSVYSQIAQAAVAAVESAANPGTPIFLTGHSRGGAVATVLAAMLRQAGHAVSKVITFGSPRVGTEAFCNAYTIPSLHVRAWQDPICGIPYGNTRVWATGLALTGLVGDLFTPGTEYGFGPGDTFLDNARRRAAYFAYLAGANAQFVSAHSYANYGRSLTSLFEYDRPAHQDKWPLVRYVQSIASLWDFQ